MKVNPKYPIAFFIFLLAVFIINYVVAFVPNDILTHVGHILKIKQGTHPYPANFLFYLIVNVLTFFTITKNSVLTVAILVLAAATMFKYIVTCSALNYFSKEYKLDLNPRKIPWISLVLFFCFSIPDWYGVGELGCYYLGRTVPIAWHNSTMILVFPFAILLFWKQLELFRAQKHSTRQLLLLTFLVILNIIIKPSFLFVYLPVTGLFLLGNIKKTGLKNAMLGIIPLAAGALFIAAQYILIYVFQLSATNQVTSGIQLTTPFYVLGLWIPKTYIPIAYLMSFILPLSTLFLYPKVIRFKPFNYSFWLMVAGILLSAFVAEIGHRMDHGNFFWQNVVCVYVLFVSNVLFLLKQRAEGSNSWKIYLLFSIFGIHVISGVGYIIYILSTNSYY